MNLIGPQDYVSLLMTSIKGRINHMHKGNCDETKWDSRLISKYNVTLVFTVDSKGCGNFTKVQEAVNAVPD
ncbi:putative pectin lyase [Medicago truncatula]|uniref:Putative pectin lyase n=1 Tax=Medicago truncatula TaxID=3880 RepID=A0A396H5L6_MEDTR|nr:putative pectin lyase [Medicago truncatula]